MRAFKPLRFLKREAAQLEKAGGTRGYTQTESGAPQRRKAVILTAILTLIIGLIELPLPAEDAYRAVRAELREKAPPQNIVLVEIDDRTLRELEVREPTRAQNGQLIDILFANGAKGFVFDRAFADPSDLEDDRLFAEALARHGDKVRLGASPEIDVGFQKQEALLPNVRLLPYANLASMKGIVNPFDLSVQFPTESTIGNQTIPSISAFLSEYNGPEGNFRPDFAFDAEKVPTVSFIDVLNGKTPASSVSGKKFIIAPTHIGAEDIKSLPSGKRVPGAYLHILAAHTLAQGLPVDLGWVPAVCFVLIILCVQAFRRRPSKPLYWATLAALLLLPIGLDGLRVNLDVMPALLGFMIGGWYLHRLAKKQYSEDNDCLKVSALLAQQETIDRDVFALKIRNFGALRSLLAPMKPNDIIALVTNRIESSEETTSFAFEDNTIIWLKPRTGQDEVSDHGHGLQALFQSGIFVDGQVVNFSVALGIDVNHELPANDRVQNAIQCAGDAAETSAAVKIADQFYLSDREQQSSLLSDLDLALEEKTIALAYQPKVMIANGAIYGAEALLRWTHPEHGEVSAQKIVKLAENNGRIGRLTECVLEIALQEACAAIELNPHFMLAVNISAQSLSDDLFVSMLNAQLRRSGFPARNLVLEITETAPLDANKAAETLSELRVMNIQLSIDDFGTGQSNLEYLRRIPSSEIKIDRQFVTHMDQSDEDRAVVIATIGLANALNRAVIAEGVETQEVANLLASLGCKRAQGYLYSSAIPIRQLLGKIYRGRIAA